MVRASLRKRSKRAGARVSRERSAFLMANLDWCVRAVGCKKVGQSFVNGPALVGLARAYCCAINEGGVPTIYSAWHGVRAQQSQEALELALNTAQTEFHAILASAP